MSLKGYNTRYGMEKLFREYSKYPDFFPFPAMYQHGLLATGKPFFMDKYSSKKVMLVSSVKDLEEWNKDPVKPAHIVANYILLFAHNNQVNRNPTGNGTIAFPLHSIDQADIIFDIDEYCEELLNLPKEFHPITICLHQIDYKDKAYLFDKYKDIRFVTAGCGMSYEWGFRFFEILKKHKYATSNYPGTFLLASLYLDIPFFLSGEKEYKVKCKTDDEVTIKHLEMFTTYENHVQTSAFKTFSYESSTFISKEQKRFLKDFGGLEDQISPIKLNLVLTKYYFIEMIEKYSFNAIPKIFKLIFSHLIMQKRVKDFTKKNQGKKVCIWGGGFITKHILEVFDFSGVEIVSIIDKNEEKHGQKIFNHKIKSLSSLEESKSDIILPFLLENHLNSVNDYVKEKSLNKEVVYLLKGLAFQPILESPI